MAIIRGGPPEPEPDHEPNLADFGLTEREPLPEPPALDASGERMLAYGVFNLPSLSAVDRAAVDALKDYMTRAVERTGFSLERVLLALRPLSSEPGGADPFARADPRIAWRALRELIREAITNRRAIDARLAVHDSVVIVEWIEERSPGKTAVRSAAFESADDAEAFTRRLAQTDASYTRHVAQFQAKGGSDIRL